MTVVTRPAIGPSERAQMWYNFLYACKLGAVVLASDTIVWQKKSRDMWQMVGSATEYSTDSIAWPVHQLLEGVV